MKDKEMLEYKIQVLCDTCDINDRQKAEIEKLERTISHLEDYSNGIADKVKAEAIKEFAKRLKKQMTPLPPRHLIDYVWFSSLLDKVLKEMVGE